MVSEISGQSTQGRQGDRFLGNVRSHVAAPAQQPPGYPGAQQAAASHSGTAAGSRPAGVPLSSDPALATGKDQQEASDEEVGRDCFFLLRLRAYRTQLAAASV